jgi:hypothetical protein
VTPAIGPTVVMMTGIEADVAAGDKPLSVLPRRRQAFVDQRADDAPAHRAAHALPGDRRTGVEQGVTGHSGHDLDRRAHVDQDLVGGEDAIEREAIRGVDGVAPERGEIARHRRRPPVHPPHRHALGDEGRSEEIGPDHDGPQRLAEQRGLRRHRVPRRSRAP